MSNGTQVPPEVERLVNYVDSIRKSYDGTKPLSLRVMSRALYCVIGAASTLIEKIEDRKKAEEDNNKDGVWYF
jgi:hypothetical protein